MPAGGQEITQLLSAMRHGDSEAGQRLLPLVYDELRSLARMRMAGLAADQTLQPTALVHEAYIRLMGSEQAGWETRGHFFAAAARTMRNILVDQARRRARLKRGGDRQKLSMDDATPIIEPPDIDLLALDEALVRFEDLDKQKSELVNLRFFAGLSSQDAAQALGISKPTADRYWKYARAWLHREMRKGDSMSGGLTSND